MPPKRSKERPGVSTAALERYADLIVSTGANVQPGQLVQVTAEAVVRDFAVRVVESAYRRGAGYVHLDLIEPRSARSRFLHAAPESLDRVPDFLRAKADELVETRAATIRLVGSENPDILADLEPAWLNRARLATFRAAKRFYDDGIGRNRVHWTVAGAATAGWGMKVFPDLEPAAAETRLWEEILRLVRADREDCLAVWAEHDAALHARAAALDALGIDELRFHGPGTDLAVGLSEAARFRGGSDAGPYGAPFEPNIPTEEVFTTPDWRRTRGRARVTRPFLVNGKLIEGLTLEFEDGRIVRFDAESGAETFGAYIDSDAGARQLGEVALVGTDSPVFRSGLVFQEILFDENAACHIAVGSAYKTCLAGGETLSDAEIAALGCNVSSAHTDMMISDERVDVVARTRGGREVPLLVKGEWRI
jgi:aminopeptidase